MACQTQFPIDVFISYRRATNKSSDHWVDEFKDALQLEMEDLSVNPPKIWRDIENISEGEAWREELQKNIENAAIFLAIISKSYFESDECIKELNHFLGRLKDPKNGAMRKLFQVFKHPSNSEIPREFNDLERVEFFQRDRDPKKFVAFSPAKDSSTHTQFNEKLSQLAQGVMLALEALQAKGRPTLGRVFLARVAPELINERDRLRADLQQQGYEVVPKKEYFWNADDIRQRILDDLEGAQLAVHLVPSMASVEKNTADWTRTQIELAIGVMKAHHRPVPLVWIAPASETDSSMRKLIYNVEHELAEDGVQYWKGGLEEFKNQIYDKLPKPPAVAAEVAGGEDGLDTIALLVEESDLVGLGPLKSKLTGELGLEPLTVKFSQAAPKDRERLVSTLTRCNKAIIYWGQQGEEWLQDLLRVPELKSHKRCDRLAVFIDGPDSDEKSVFSSKWACTIRGSTQTAAEALKSFMAARFEGAGS